MKHLETCDTCMGEGYIAIFLEPTTSYETIEYETCEDCDGKGEVWIEEND